MAAATEPAWILRPGRPDDTPGVLDLFHATFGKSITAAAYRWKFLESPWPIAAATTFVAELEGRIVGHFGGTPVRLRLGEQQIAAVHAGDVMVAADLRRQGIMTAVGRAASQAWAAGGAELVLALPTQDFTGLRARLDYRPTFELGWLWRPLRPQVMFGRSGAGRGVEVSAVDEPGAEFDELWEAAQARHDVLVVRDGAWLAYRYARAPGPGYRILLARARGRPVGYLVYRLHAPDGGRGAWIADLFTVADDGSAAAALVRAACAELHRAGESAVRIFAAPGSSIHSGLRRAGFLPRRGAYDVRVVPLVGGLPWDALRDPRRFFLMGGDFDVV